MSATMAAMPIRALFPTLIYSAALQTRGSRDFNRQLMREIAQLQHDDEAGSRWSRANYPGGFTSYASANRLHAVSPTFASLQTRIAPHLRTFCRSLGLDLRGRRLAMTDCWANVMPRGVVHGLHLHPLSTISGTYYVKVPAGAPGLKLEDPRLDRMMASPPRPAWVTISARDGLLVLFESWLRHEVPMNAIRAQRVSVSFNFNWF
jgi:uncharacterized protein (TIGR02466 family)